MVAGGTELSGLRTKAVKRGKFRSLAGKPLDAVFFHTPEDQRAAQGALPREALFEWDVDPVHRFLMEKKILGGVAFEGMGKAHEDGTVHFTAEKFAPSDFKPDLKVLSIDIETGVESGRLYSVAYHLTGGARELTRVDMLAEKTSKADANLHYCATEEELLKNLGAFLRREDPQLIIGWNVVGFDLEYLVSKCQAKGVPIDWGVGGRVPDFYRGKTGRDFFIKIPGRAILDGIPSMRVAGYKFAAWGLENVSRELLGEGKLIAPNEDKIGEIEHLFANDKPKLAEYNLKDTELVTRIFLHARIVDLFLERQRLCGAPIEKQQFPSEILDFLYLPLLHRSGFAAPTANPAASAPSVLAQAPVRAPLPGHYHGAVEIAPNGFLPSILETFLMDPLGRALAEAKDENNLKIPGSLVPFNRKRHLLPAVLARLAAFDAKDGALGTGATLRQSIRQAFESSSSRFYSPSLAACMRTAARLVCQEAVGFLETQGLTVVDADGESILAYSREGKMDQILKQALSGLHTQLRHTLEKSFDLEPRFRFEALSHWSRLFIPAKALPDQPETIRRYAALPQGAKPDAMVLVQMEGNRWEEPPLAGKFLRELLTAFFTQLNPSEVTGRIRKDLQEGKLDADLVMTRRIRRDQMDIEKNPPPHVVAARKLGKLPPNNQISWLMTENGPEPTQKRTARPDAAWYREHVLLPIAERVLTGTAYATAVDDLRKASDQLSFF
jgi:DNA polymerase-2